MYGVCGVPVARASTRSSPVVVLRATTPARTVNWESLGVHRAGSFPYCLRTASAMDEDMYDMIK